MSKYKNKKVTVGDLHFDSLKEARRYKELLEEQKTGTLTDLETQVRFELIPKQDGERACFYVADFVYKDREGKTVVEDVKGSRRMLTDVYKIKKKLMLKVHGIKVKEIFWENFLFFIIKKTFKRRSNTILKKEIQLYKNTFRIIGKKSKQKIKTLKKEGD